MRARTRFQIVFNQNIYPFHEELGQFVAGVYKEGNKETQITVIDGISFGAFVQDVDGKKRLYRVFSQSNEENHANVLEFEFMGEGSKPVAIAFTAVVQKFFEQSKHHKDYRILEYNIKVRHMLETT